jgi:diaminohydroxyphosphoribosylaminopyrimidine deaminase/5-amino-6-(5-phosphoribosylamino)uracil reductase
LRTFFAFSPFPLFALSETMTEVAQSYMKLALRLAAKGAGWVSPNPMVGAVLVQDGRIVGRGYHRRLGAPHAEVEALRQAGAAARGADLYVTLEPCNHQGRTPPCTQAVLAAGVRRVLIATPDPNPRVAGGGAAFLQAHGVEVQTGLLAAEARRLNEAWFKWVATGLPFVVAKAACSLDGKIATVAGESQWLTGEAARAYGHRLRHACDAILVGIATVLADDPQLTVRLGGKRKNFGGEGQGSTTPAISPKPPLPTPYVSSGTGFQPVPDGRRASSELTRNPEPGTQNPGKDPIRVVLDSRLRIPLTARLLHLNSPAPTWVACTKAAPKDKIKALKDLGAEVLVLPATGPAESAAAPGRVALQPLLELLGRRQVQSLLVEGGAQVLGGFFAANLVDKFYFFYAPLFLGGSAAPGVLGGPGIPRLSDAPRARDLAIRRLGSDLMVSGYLEK